MHLSRILQSLVLATLLAACGDQQPPQPAETAAEDDAPQVVERAAPRRVVGDAPERELRERTGPLAKIPRLTGQLEAPGSGLDMPIFATDRADFIASLEAISESVNDQQMQQLEGSWRYLLINANWIMYDEQKFFDYVDGKSGQEIIDAGVRALNKERE